MSNADERIEIQRGIAEIAAMPNPDAAVQQAYSRSWIEECKKIESAPTADDLRVYRWRPTDVDKAALESYKRPFGHAYYHNSTPVGGFLLRFA